MDRRGEYRLSSGGAKFHQRRAGKAQPFSHRLADLKFLGPYLIQATVQPMAFGIASSAKGGGHFGENPGGKPAGFRAVTVDVSQTTGRLAQKHSDILLFITAVLGYINFFDS